MLKKKRFRSCLIPKSITFLSKLYDILNDEQYKGIIHWNKEGKAIVINDISKLCEIVLAKFYKHRNYSSFVRQLNKYGFSKVKGGGKEELIFEHDKFNKNITKEQIKDIIQEKGKVKLCENYDIDDINIYRLLLNKYEENKNEISYLRKEIENLRQINNDLLTNIQFLKQKLYGHSIILQKILLNNNDNNNGINCYEQKNKSQNLKELLKKYLYYLHIYSPYVTIKGNRTEKVHSFKIGSINVSNNKIEIYNSNINNINNINNISFIHNESIDDLSFFSSKINDRKFS